MNARDWRAIRLGASALGLLLIGWFLVLPGLESWGQARQRIDAANEAIQDLEAKHQRLLSLDRRVQEVYGPSAKKPLPGLDAARTDFPIAVQKLVSSSGIQLRSLQPESPRPLREVPQAVLLPVQVQGTCQLQQVVQFLAALRASETLVIVDRVEATSNPQSPGQLSVTLALSTLARQEARP